MKKAIVLICALALASLVPLPSMAADKLPAPHVTAIVAVDYASVGATDIGWCIFVEWEAVADASTYSVRVRGKKGLTPVPANGSPVVQARWKYVTEYGYNPENAASVPICMLAEDQKVKFRVRAVKSGDPNEYGKATAPFTVKLPKYGDAPFMPRFGTNAVEVFGTYGG